MAYYYKTVNGGDSTASTKKKKNVEDFTGRYPGDTYNGDGFTDSNDKGDNTPPGDKSGYETLNTGKGTGKGSGSFGYSQYNPSQSVVDAQNALNSYAANPVSAWNGGTYGASLQQAINKILNREQFSYDLNADALYQQYKDKYLTLGNMAMQDTMGQASGMTGGYGNSYASTAGNQAYQGYLQNLNDVVPELYSLAYSKYEQEGQNLLNNYNALNNAYQTEYGQYRDKVNDWYNEYDRLANAYYNAYNQDYGLYSDNYDRALQTAQYNASRASASGSGSSGTVYRPAGISDELWSALKTRINNGATAEEINGYLKYLGIDDVQIKNVIASTGQFLDEGISDVNGNGKEDDTKEPEDYGQYGGSIYSKGNYSLVLNDIKSMDKATARDYVKTQWENGNLTTQEYNTLINKIRG